MKATHELTNLELRAELAEWQGWHFVEMTAEEFQAFRWGYMNVDPQSRMIVLFDAHGGYWDYWHETSNVFHPSLTEEQYLDALYASLPYWEQDIGAAFELCLSVLEALNNQDTPDVFLFEVSTVACWCARYALTGVYIDSIATVEGNSARALSELALMALRGMEG